MKCLVTGATGFTGGHLAHALLREGHTVRALVRPGSNAAALDEAGVELFEGQLTDPDDVVAAASGCDQIYHIAAVFRTAGHPDSYYRAVNVGGTLNVLAAARRHGCERVIHCSTGGVHGHIEEPPAAEDYPLSPGDIYQQTKLEAEIEVGEAMKRGQPISVFRPGPIYGTGDLRFLKLFRAIRNSRFVMIGPGTPRLHMIHIDDLVRGILLCGERSEALGDVFLLAGPEAPTLNELIAIAADAMGVPGPRLRIPVWPVYAAGWLCETLCVPLRVDPPLYRRRVAFFTHHREFDIGRARRLLGFEPQVTVRQGIARTAAWYAEQGLIAPVPARV